MSQDTFYITTPIYYVNDVPHLGHAYTTIVADTFVRYHRADGTPNRTYFLTGTDEHGQKIQRAAEAAGERPQELADRVVQRFDGLWRALGISNDDFIRTTQQRHKTYAQSLWQKLLAAGDIYKDTYAGWYSVADEAFYTEKEIEDQGLDKESLEYREEESYFFRLSAYQDQLLALYNEQPGFVRPKSRLNEVRRFVEGGLQDLSISRTAIDWGIPVPDDPEHVMYVWLDALSNYISALGGEGAENYTTFWPASVHLIGKDILRFHAVYWPAFLMSAGLPLPETIIAHGWWTIEGQKMSKRLQNVVDPYFLIDEYGRDVVRYFVLREVPLGNDGDFSHRNLLNRVNADLANDLGNLVSRSIGMLMRYRGGVVPEDGLARDLQGDAHEARTSIRLAMTESFQPNLALEALWRLVTRANRYVDEQAPWDLAKSGLDAELDAFLTELLVTVARVAVLLAPFMPDTARHILERVGSPLAHADADVDGGRGWAFDTIEDRQALLGSGATLSKSAPLFPRMSDKELAKRLDTIAEMAGGTPAGETTPTEAADAEVEQDPHISIDQFFETRLVVGEVVAAEAVPKSSKLLKLTVTLGEAQDRTIVSGIAGSYTPEQLVGTRVIVVANLKPAKLMGIQSEGMVLAGEAADGRIIVCEPHPDVAVGCQIK